MGFGTCKEQKEIISIGLEGNKGRRTENNHFILILSSSHIQVHGYLKTYIKYLLACFYVSKASIALPGLSTFITSAPRSPKFIVAKGPASTLQC